MGHVLKVTVPHCGSVSLAVDRATLAVGNLGDRKYLVQARHRANVICCLQDLTACHSRLVLLVCARGSAKQRFSGVVDHSNSDKFTAGVCNGGAGA